MKKLSPKQKASIALAALRGEKISKLSSDYQVHPNQIGKWKKLAEEELVVMAVHYILFFAKITLKSRIGKGLFVCFSTKNTNKNPLLKVFFK